MKKLIFVLIAFMILGCNQNLKKKGDLLGRWDWVSSTDIETGEVDLFDGDSLEFVEIKSDTIYLMLGLDIDAVYPWRIEGDSIFLDDDYMSFYIKELTKNELVVEYDGKKLFTLKKRK